MRQQTTKMADDKRELDGFLSKVDEIGKFEMSVVKTAKCQDCILLVLSYC